MAALLDHLHCNPPLLVSVRPSCRWCAAWFSAGALQAIPMIPTQQQIENDQSAVGQHVAASMLKMSYAAYSKGASALLLSVNALAEAGGVTEALHAEWALSAHLLKQSQRAAQMTSGKAWRFEGEMLEISETYSNAGLMLCTLARQRYQRMAALKDLPPQELEAVVAALLRQSMRKDLSTGYLRLRAQVGRLDHNE